MKRLILLSLLTAFPAFASRQIIPVAGHLPGAAGTFWSTDITLTNSTTTSQDVQLIFHPAPDVALTRNVQLAAGESRLLQDAVHPDDFGGQSVTPWLGLLEVVAPGVIKASSRTFSGDESAGGTFGASYDAVDPDILPSRGVITGVLVNSRFRTNVAFTNATSHSETFRFDIRDDSGAIRNSDAVGIAAMTTVQIAVGPYVPGLEDRSLSVSWSTDDRGFALASVVDNKSGDPTAISSVAVGSNELFFPIVASTPGLQNTFWTTSIAVTSDSDSAGQLTLRFAGNDDTHVERHVSLAPHGTFRSDDLFTLLGLTSGSGFLTVDATVPVVGSERVFNTTEDRGTFGSSIPAQQRVAKATRLRIDGVRRDANFRLNVGLANEDRIAANGTIRLFDDRGHFVEEQHFSLRPSSSAQFSISATQVEVRGGEVEVEVENGVPVTAIASNVDNRSGDTTVVEVEQENERQQGAEISFSPKTALAGTPVTLTANLSGFSTPTFTWNFGDGSTATGKTVTHTFVNSGEYIITVTATLSGGATVREVEDITVLGTDGTNPNASFDFTWSPLLPQPGQPVAFVSSGGSGTVKWHFPGDIRLTGNSVTFTFAAAGSLEVEAEIEREGNSTVRAEHLVTVTGGTTNPGGPAATINISVNPSSPMAGQTVTFSATFDAPPAAGSIVKWRFHDGSRPTGNPVTFTYASSGSFQVEAELEQPGLVTIQKKIFVTVQ